MEYILCLFDLSINKSHKLLINSVINNTNHLLLEGTSFPFRLCLIVHCVPSKTSTFNSIRSKWLGFTYNLLVSWHSLGYANKRVWQRLHILLFQCCTGIIFNKCRMVNLMDWLFSLKVPLWHLSFILLVVHFPLQDSTLISVFQANTKCSKNKKYHSKL